MCVQGSVFVHNVGQQACPGLCSLFSETNDWLADKKFGTFTEVLIPDLLPPGIALFVFPPLLWLYSFLEKTTCQVTISQIKANLPPLLECMLSPLHGVKCSHLSSLCVVSEQKLLRNWVSVQYEIRASDNQLLLPVASLQSCFLCPVAWKLCSEIEPGEWVYIVLRKSWKV